jgi:hypothetical protein
MAIDADEFYAQMEKPVPPQPDGILGSAVSVKEGVVSSGPSDPTPDPVRRPVAASLDLEKPTAQEIDEQRRQAAADLAEQMYGDAPMGDGVRYDEVALTNHQEFSLDVPEDLAANLGEGEAQQITSAFIESGVGRTMAIDLVRQGIEASRRGPLSAEQVQRMNGNGMKDLQAKWGAQAGAKLELAKGMIRDAEKQWPGLRNYLNATGLGSDPKLIQQLVARAERRPGRK